MGLKILKSGLAHDSFFLETLLSLFIIFIFVLFTQIFFYTLKLKNKQKKLIKILNDINHIDIKKEFLKRILKKEFKIKI